MDIASGRPTESQAYLGYDPAAHPGVAPSTPRFPEGSEQGGVRDTTGERLSQLAVGEAAWGAAQAQALAADSERRTSYEQSLMVTGASYGDQLAIPRVPEDANAPAADFLYGTGGGDQPGRGA